MLGGMGGSVGHRAILLFGGGALVCGAIRSIRAKGPGEATLTGAPAHRARWRERNSVRVGAARPAVEMESLGPDVPIRHRPGDVPAFAAELHVPAGEAARLDGTPAGLDRSLSARGLDHEWGYALDEDGQVRLVRR